MSTWRERIQHIIDGEQVSAGVAGRPDRQLEENLQYVKQLLDLAELGQALIASDIAVDPTVTVGMPVYWDTDNSWAAPAVAKVTFDTGINTLVSAPEAEIFGVVYKKYNDNTADIVIWGRATIDLSAVCTTPAVAGRYYLSGNTPGQLELSRASLSIPVLYSDGAGSVIVSPQSRNWGEEHTHYSFKLYCRPCGTESIVATGCGNVKQIINVDDSYPGWLPANHASFNGLAPTGAQFGYNIAKHTELNSVWPPFPADAASIVWNKGLNYVGGTEVPSGTNGFVLIDENGIWWTTNCEAHVPWPSIQEISEVSELLHDACSCPPVDDMTMTLYFSRALFEANKTVVTSIEAEPNSLINITNVNGGAASTGRLVVSANLSFSVVNQTTTGYYAIKQVSGNKFYMGPVVEGIVVTDNSITISGSTHYTANGQTIYQGVVKLSAAPAATTELYPQVIKLSESRERFENGVPYVGLPAGYDSSITYSFYVPRNGLGDNIQVRLIAAFLGTVAGSLPFFTFTYRIIPQANYTAANWPLPTTDTALPFATPYTVNYTAANQYGQVQSNLIDVSEGDTVLVTIARASTDSYTGEVGVLKAIMAVSS